MKISTPLIQAKHALGRAQTEDYVDWATGALVDGMDSPCLRILAGFDKSASLFETQEYYSKCRGDLSLGELAKEEATGVYAMHFAVHFARQILEPGSDYETLAHQIARLACSPDVHQESLGVWLELSEKFIDLECGDGACVFDESERADTRGAVEKAARKFIEENAGDDCFQIRWVRPIIPKR